MAANTSPIFPSVPYCGNANMTAVSACTTRAPIATASLSANNLVEFVGTSTNGRKIDYIQVKASGTSITTANAANLVQIWVWDGTNAYLYDEIAVTAITPSTTSASFSTSKAYTTLVLPPTYKLYVSATVDTTAAGTALIVTANGGDY